MKTRLIVYGLLAFCCVAVLSFLIRGSAVTEDNCLRIELGMTRSEVELLLRAVPDHAWTICDDKIFHENYLGWNGTAMVAYDPQGRVIWRAWDETRRRPPAWVILLRQVYPEVRE